MKTIAPRQRDILSDLLSASIVELLDAYGLDAVAVDDPDIAEEGPGVAGVIGFVCDAMRGSLVVYGSKRLLAAMGQTNGSDLGLRDWAGEVANQTLGRLKNKLLHYGVMLNMTTPVVVVGFRLDVTAPGAAPRVAVAASSVHGTVRVALDVVAEPDALVGAIESIPMGAVEGELLLF